MRGLINGRWVRRIEGDDIAPVFANSTFYGTIPSDRHPVVNGRYHLYVSYACPFAHMTLLARHLKGLDAALGISVCDPYLGGSDGWFFAHPDVPSTYEGVTVDRINGARFLYEIYTRAVPHFSGRVTVPVLWDIEAETIVSNDSTEILKLLNDGLSPLAEKDIDLDPSALKPQSNELAQWIRDRINVGVYRVGTSNTQSTYDASVRQLFDAFHRMDERLAAGGPYLFGDTLTFCDLRLFVTLIRLDVGYSGALYCNLKRLSDFPELLEYAKRLYYREGIAETVKFDHYLRHYYDDNVFVNRRRINGNHYIVPAGPIPFADER